MSGEIVKSKNKKKGSKKTEDTSDLLSTASDLYRQIEAAAASALSTHPSFAASFPPPPTGTATDEAYWTSLPQHLRQFIRSALPLAAGLTQPSNAGQLGIGVGLTQVNGQPLPPLTHEQLSSAAAQLAQVVQSNWGQLGLGPIPPGAQQQLNNSTNGNSRSNTISLGSFPVTMPTREQMEAAIGSISAMDMESNSPNDIKLEEEMYDLTDEEESKEGLESNAAKKKKKKNKKKSTMVTIDMSLSPPRPNRTPSLTPSTTKPTRMSPPASTLPQSIAAGKQPIPPSKYPDSSNTTKSPPVVMSTPSIAPKAGPSSEREKIRDFWLGLAENERRDLVTLEKKQVLQKMKDQQKTGCLCAVCGRKRTAIEEELEVLYDAYYDELESYALHQVRYASSGGTIAPPPGPGPFPGSVDSSTLPLPSTPIPAKKSSIKTTRDHKNVRPMKKSIGLSRREEGPAHGEPGHTHSTSCPHHPGNFDSKVTSATKGEKAKGAEILEGDFESDEGEFGEDEEEEEDYDEEEEEFDEEEENAEERKKRVTDSNGNSTTGTDGKSNPPTGGADFFGFGKSLTVKGGILTVADDLLKNDGQKFLEMMEQLADKRIQRERDSTVLLDSSSSDSEDDGEEGEEYGSDEDDSDEEEEEEEEEVMTEEERMEEGRRMFQIFAARMFEQRVLTSYREKVASERQFQLLKELEEEERIAEEKEIKKAKENQKKKDKKKDQKQKKEEDRLLKQAEKDALELSFRLSESIRIEEERRRSEEQRTKREAERKLKEEEKLRVAEEKRKRTEEETRKRKEKEEKARVEKELRIMKEKEERDRKAKEDAERKAKDLADRLEREEKAEKERLEKERLELESRERAEKDRIAKAAQAAATAAARIKAQTAKSLPLRLPTPSKPIPGLAKSPTPTKAAIIPPISNGPPPLRNGVNPPPPQRKPSLSNGPVTNNLSAPAPISIGYNRGPPSNGPPLIPTGPSSYGQLHSHPQQIQQRIPSQPPPPPMQSIPSSGIPSAASRSFGPAGGFGNWNSNSTASYPNQQTSSFVAHPQTQHSIGQVSPVLQRAPIGPPPPLPNILSPISISRGIEGNGGPSPRVNGFAPIGPPPVMQPSLISPTPISRGGPIGTIGRPGVGISAIGTGRGLPASPPRIFGSSALREEDEIVPSSSGRGNWNSPFGSIWSASPAVVPAAVPQPPDRLSVIRDRARISFLRIGSREVALGDLHELMGKLFEDSGSVDLRELVESMLVIGNAGNGGGLFSFRERGEGLLVAFDA